MIRKLARQMLTAQILSALTVSLCLLIDNIIIGRFLGVEAIAAYGLANPVLLITGAIASMLSAGVQVACSKSLGSGSQEETNRGYSSAVGLSMVIALAFMLVVFPLRNTLSTLLGAGTEGPLYDDTRNYIAGFVVGTPASMGALILVPFLQMAGQGNLLVVAVLSMTVSDVALDLLNVMVFNGGMFGMGLASSISYYVAIFISLFYFLSKKCVFRFSFQLISGRKILELFRGGIPTLVNMAALVVLIFAMNKVMLGAGGSVAVAAFSVVNTIGGSSNSISTGMNGVSLTLTGIFFNEEDRTALKELLGHLTRYAVYLGLAVGALLAIFAPALVALFIPEAGSSQSLAILGLRLFAIGLTPCCVLNAVKGGFQGSGRDGLTEVVCLMEGAILPVLAAWLFSQFMGPTGAMLYFVLGEILALTGVCCYVWYRNRRFSLSREDFLLLPADFGVRPEDLMEADIHSLEDVASTAEAANRFCESHGPGKKFSNHIALCVEEMASNTVEHGFAPGGGNHLSVRILRKGRKWVLRFRDDCRAFDPVNYVPKEGHRDALGIHLVMAMADEIRYTYSLSLNNLTLILDEKADA